MITHGPLQMRHADIVVGLESVRVAEFVTP